MAKPPLRRKSPTRHVSARSPYHVWQAIHKSPPETLYHYTDTVGLLSMLSDGHVWATESRYMNDPREFVHGAELIMEVLEKRLAAKPHPSLVFLKDEVADQIKEKMQNMRIFFVSFCTKGDLLSQWRGYGDRGGGYALGFRSDLLFGPKDEGEDAPMRVLRRIVYNRTEQRRLVALWLDAIVAANNVPALFWSFFSEILICFKDYAYREEGEWRLVQFGRFQAGPESWSYPVSFRQRRGQLIPYADLNLSKSQGAYAGKLPIGDIVYGPTQDPERSDKALRLLLESRGYQNNSKVALHRSKVPFTS
jgi:hypothetical protein